jgi:Protein of unknown function (DUF2726)
MQPISPWLLAVLASLLFLVGSALGWAATRRQRRPPALPAKWAIAPRSVFSTVERRLYRAMRDALPQHVVLAKLPLVRFCQPTEPGEVRYWFDLLGASHVGFAICSANGRVLAAIDVDVDHGLGRRSAQIKQAVLAACRVRYVRCRSDRLPGASEIQQWIPAPPVAPVVPSGTSMPSTATARPSVEAVAPTLHQARDSLASAVAHRRAERTAMWQDSAVFQDSFFVPDTRTDGFVASEFATFAGPSRSGGTTGNERFSGRPEAPATAVPAANTDTPSGTSSDGSATRRR